MPRASLSPRPGSWNQFPFYFSSIFLKFITCEFISLLHLKFFENTNDVLLSFHPLLIECCLRHTVGGHIIVRPAFHYPVLLLSLSERQRLGSPGVDQASVNSDFGRSGSDPRTQWSQSSDFWDKLLTFKEPKKSSFEN
jgi:hypothetical protein